MVVPFCCCCCCFWSCVCWGVALGGDGGCGWWDGVRGGACGPWCFPAAVAGTGGCCCRSCRPITAALFIVRPGASGYAALPPSGWGAERGRAPPKPPGPGELNGDDMAEGPTPTISLPRAAAAADPGDLAREKGRQRPTSLHPETTSRTSFFPFRSGRREKPRSIVCTCASSSRLDLITIQLADRNVEGLIGFSISSIPDTHVCSYNFHFQEIVYIQFSVNKQFKDYHTKN